MGVFQYLEDVESDMSVFHRIDDVRKMPAQRFIDFASRLTAYRGVMRARAEAQAEKDNDPHTAPSQASTSHLDYTHNRTVPSDRDTLMSDPAFQGLIEVKGEPDA